MKLTVASPLPGVAMAPVGAAGTGTGVVAPDAVDAVEVPAEFVAVTVKVYAVPFVRPVTTHEVAGAVALQLCPPPPDAVTV